MRDYIPLLVAFLGAFFGALFGVLRTRNERLWSDRYKSLLKVLELAEGIKTKFHSSQSDALGIEEYSLTEKKHLEEMWAGARLELHKESSRLRLLFKERESEKLVHAIQDLDRAIANSIATEGKDKRHTLNVVWSKADSCVDETIHLSRKKFL